MDKVFARIVSSPLLSRWLLEEIQRREMSVREFARFVGLTHGTLNNLLNARHTSPPTIETLSRLARATKVDLCTLVAFVAPDLTDDSGRVRLMVDRISRLPPAQQEIVDRYLLGALFKEDDEGE